MVVRGLLLALCPYVLFGMEVMDVKRYSIERDCTLSELKLMDEIEQRVKDDTPIEPLSTHEQALNLLIRYDKEWAVKKLLDQKIVPTFENVCEAIMGGRNRLLTAIIERFPFLVHGKNSIGSALHIASLVGNVEAASFLLAKGLDVNVANQYKDTPLHVAAKKGFCEMVRLLCEHGANPFLKNERQFDRHFTPMDLAYRSMWRPDKYPSVPMSDKFTLFPKILHIIYEYFPRFGGSVSY